MHREATILRREQGGGLSYMEGALEEEDEVRERASGEVEDAISGGGSCVGLGTVWE